MNLYGWLRFRLYGPPMISRRLVVIFTRPCQTCKPHRNSPPLVAILPQPHNLAG